MTVKELIEKLNKLPPNYIVVTLDEFEVVDTLISDVGVWDAMNGTVYIV